MDNVKSVMTGMMWGMRDSVCGTIMIYQLDRAQEKAKAKKRPPVDVKDLRTLAKRRAAQDNKPKPSENDEPRILHRILGCSLLNGGLIWISIAVFENLVLPTLGALTHLMYGSSPVVAGTVWFWMNLILSTTFQAVWVIPIFILSKAINSFWFQDIANLAFVHSRGRSQVFSSFSKLIADILFSILIQTMFLIQSNLVTLLPIALLGRLVSLLHMCLLYSLYAFEYKWLNMGWELHKRLSFIESNWAYFVGFGLPLAVVTELPQSIYIRGCVFSMLFPLYIISGNAAKPVTGSCDYSLQLFSPVVHLSNIIFSRTVGRKSRDVPKLPAGPTVARQQSENAYRR